uniref:Cytochrome c-553 n=1 Tax=Leptosiphonia brodiei TaxID=2608611 RepID=A0A1Z1MAA1_9FLOR|nr:cytochrome c553 [Leptosiphonia brodiei]ARW62812.1 cytochrome c553 [Leptosiphonia brodiei]
MKFLSSIFLSFFIILFICISSVFSEEFSVDLDAGEQIFTQNCVSCHAGGNNLINPDATLSLVDLKKNSRDNLPAIIKQVTNGGNGMTAFSGRLSEEDIFNVANYVFNQAKTDGW